MSNALHWRPADDGPVEQLMVLLHGVGAQAAGMAPLAQHLRREFPRAIVVAPEGFEAFDGDASGSARQWFSVMGVTEANRPDRVAAALPRLVEWLQAAQQATGIGPAATALWGFSQGAIMAMALAQAHDGAVGRVVAFAGRYARLPDHAPQHTTLHLLHGQNDAVIPVEHARQALGRLAELQGDATLDIAQGVGHEINGALLQQALFRLRNHIPQRTWMAALGAAAGLQAAADDGE